MNESQRIKQHDIRRTRVYRFAREGMHYKKVAKRNKKKKDMMR